MISQLILNGRLIFVMGGGKFGTKAVKFLKTNKAKVLVIDLDPYCLAKSEVDLQIDLSYDFGSLENGQAAFLLGNSIELMPVLLEKNVPDFIVTAIPGNALAEVVEIYFNIRGIKLEPYLEVIPKVLRNIPESLVSFIDYVRGIIVVSYMQPDMICIENCLPPKHICASTGNPKLVNMDELLKFSVFNLTEISSIFTSHQLIVGLGAINGKEFHTFLEQLNSIKLPFTIAVGTACNCHGILNIVKVKK